MPKVREAIKLIEADGWRKMTTKGSHRQVKYQRRTAQPLTRPEREGYPGCFWLMGEVLPPLFTEILSKLVYLSSTSTIQPTLFRPAPPVLPLGRAENSQTSGLYVLEGLYVLDQYYL